MVQIRQRQHDRAARDERWARHGGRIERSPPHHRRVLMQGRRRQVHDVGEPRVHTPDDGREGWHLRRRRLRPVAAHHDIPGIRGAADGQRNWKHHAYGVRRRRHRLIRVRRPRFRHHARAYGQRVDQPDADHDELGRAGLPHHRHAPRHRGRAAHDLPGAANHRRGRRHHAAEARVHRRGEGRADVQQAAGSVRRGRREHELL
mmetsp:Transcript_2927/g.13823  ORF Transcript_2927/g.13823 Transcript_2927/m.13823 type:complete len:203 (-) Transcript_2927:592-1200(-)